MCVGICGEVLTIEGERAKVLYQGNILDVILGLVRAQVGDQVMVHAGCAICIVSKAEAEEMEVLLQTLEGIWNED